MRLRLRVDARHGRRSGERLRAELHDRAQASVWFCGPPHCGRALRADLHAHGLPAERFHQALLRRR